MDGRTAANGTTSGRGYFLTAPWQTTCKRGRVSAGILREAQRGIMSPLEKTRSRAMETLLALLRDVMDTHAETEGIHETTAILRGMILEEDPPIVSSLCTSMMKRSRQQQQRDSKGAKGAKGKREEEEDKQAGFWDAAAQASASLQGVLLFCPDVGMLALRMKVTAIAVDMIEKASRIVFNSISISNGLGEKEVGTPTDECRDAAVRALEAFVLLIVTMVDAEDKFTGISPNGPESLIDEYVGKLFAKIALHSIRSGGDVPSVVRLRETLGESICMIADHLRYRFDESESMPFKQGYRELHYDWVTQVKEELGDAVDDALVGFASTFEEHNQFIINGDLKGGRLSRQPSSNREGGDSPRQAWD